MSEERSIVAVPSSKYGLSLSALECALRDMEFSGVGKVTDITAMRNSVLIL